MDDSVLVATLAGLQDRIDAMRGETRQQIAELRDDTRQQIAELLKETNYQVSKLNGRLSTLSNDVTGMRGEIVGKLAQIEDRLTQFGDDVFVAMASAGNAVDRTEGVRSEMETLTKIVSSMQRTLQRVQVRLGDLEGKAPGT
jgi:hypothetical protein